MDKLSEAKKAEIINTFAILDVDGSGLITASELRAMMSVFGYNNSEEDIQRMIDAVDTDGTGKLNCSKFCAALLWKENQCNACTQTTNDNSTDKTNAQ
ncbi:hypothetical protein ACLKA7_007193 [Drosophila subpalustris]